jgi:twitching motility protein PilI
MSDRPSLREYQQNLHKRLQGDAAIESTQSARLGLLAGAEHWLIRLDEAQEVMPVGALTPVPFTKAWFRGLANVRGKLYSVVDLAAFAVNPNAPLQRVPMTADARLILIADRYHVSAALMVERMLGLRTIQNLESEPIDSRPDAKRSPPWVVAHWRDPDGRCWKEVSMSELVRHNDFLQAGLSP